jgi:signal transduction histidine kinase
MDLTKYISDIYPTVGPFEGINLVEPKLLKHRYLVVVDDDEEFHGILTPCDIIEHPHKIVIDCTTKKESVSFNDTILTVLDKFRKTQCFALPVFNEKSFVGVIEKSQILSDLEFKINDLYNRSLISQKAKTHFLNNLTHEIRTPLNIILGFIDIIANLDTNNIESEQFATIIKKSADRFLFIMDDLIELSLLHAGDDPGIYKEKINIEKIFIELSDDFNELASLQNKKSTIVYSNPDYSLNIFSDEKRLKHILYHLIDNAIKFSENNKVSYGYELSADKKRIEFFVTNESPEIAEQDRLKMFDIFDKQENIGNELNFGLGIGLPLVKKLTEMLGGCIRLEVHNNEITFFVDIPTK